MTTFYAWLQYIIGLSPPIINKIAMSLLIILVLWLVNRYFTKRISRTNKDIRVTYHKRKTAVHLLGLLGILFILRVWIKGLENISTFLGLFSAGIAIALKDMLANVAGWGFISWRKPFEVGDRIEIGTHSGDVIDLRIFQFTILEIGNWVDGDQSTGRVIHIPNGSVFRETVANYNKGFEFLWNEIPVLVTFESDWKKAKQLLQEIVDTHAKNSGEMAKAKVIEASKKYMIHYKYLTPIVYTKVLDSGIQLTLRYLCDPRYRRGSTEKIWEDILSTFDQYKEIQFAYPTTRIYYSDSFMA